MPDDRRATRWRSPDEPCLNCGDPTPGRFCPTCGQRKTEVLVSVRTLLADVLEDQLVLNRALPRTLTTLLIRPGMLTEEYVRGRIVRYIAPFRLYLVSSILFFLIVSFVGLRALDTSFVAPGEAADSARVALDAQQQALAGIDTMGMPAEARAALRQGMAEAAAALEAASETAAARDSAAAQDTAAVQDSVAGGQASADSVVPPGGLQPWARNIRFNDTSPLFRRALERKLAQVGHLQPRDAIRQILRDLLEYAPHMVFLLLPVFAFLLKLLYIRRSRYYAEHFVFALHVHSFVFLMFTLMFALPDWADAFLLLWMVVYVWLAMKRMYRQGWFRTTVKWWTLGWTYAFALLFGLSGLAVVTLLLT